MRGRRPTALSRPSGAPRASLVALFAALNGVLAGYAALAVAELVAVAVGPESGPVKAVGSAVIDRAPAWLKEYAVRTFGAQDKLVLQLGILALLALFATALGVLARRHRRTGSAGVLLFGAVGALSAAERPENRLADAVPSLTGAVAGALVLFWLSGHLAVPTAARLAGGAPNGPDWWGSRAEPGSPPAVPTAEAHRLSGPRPVEELGQPTESTDTAEPTEAHPEGTALDESAPGPAEGAADRTAPCGKALTEDAPMSVSLGFDRRGFLVSAGVVAAGASGVGLLGQRLRVSSEAAASASRDTVNLPAPASRAAPVPKDAELGIDGVEPFTTPNGDFYRVDTALTVPRLDASDWRLRLRGKGVSRELALDFEQLLSRDLIERDITMTCVSNEVGGPYVGNARWLGVRLRDLLREAGVRPPSRGGPADQLVAHSADGMTLGSPVEVVMDGRDAMLAVGMNGQPLPFEHGFPVRWEWPATSGSHRLEVRATDRAGDTQTAERVGTVPDGATGRHSVVVSVS